MDRGPRWAMLLTIGVLLAAMPLARRSYNSSALGEPVPPLGGLPATVAAEIVAAPLEPVAKSVRPVAVVKQLKVDAGEVALGKPVQFRFSVRNTGSAPLEITTKPHCGCTTVRHAKSVPPGGEAIIETELNTDKTHGTVRKLVDLHTNDPDSPRFELVMVATVLPAVEVQPGPNPLFTLSSDGPTVCHLRVRTRALDDVRITCVTSSVPYATAELEPVGTDADGRLRRVNITVAPEARFGRSNFTITLATTAESQPTVPISIRCEKGIVASSETIALRVPPAGADTPVTGTMSLKTAGGPFQIRRAVASDPQLDVRTETLKDGSLYRLTVTDRRDPSKSAAPAIVTVETDNALQPRFEFAVRRFAGRPAAP